MPNAQSDYNLSTKPHCVIADGPQETDGGFRYVIGFGDDNGEFIDENNRCIWYLSDYEEVCSLVDDLCEKYALENVNEADPV